MSSLEFKCVQVDLARQKENIPYIKEFIAMASDAGYTSILLYLEDRIRTASYPFIAEEESYSVAEMEDIVRFAAEKNIELIPCVATLGHAERFLEHPELLHLSEVSDDTIDRFGRHNPRKDVFCITNDGFYPFIEKYLEEVAAIFPSVYFHTGLDEFFNFNLCPRCRELMPTLQDEEEFFLRHIIRMEQFLAKLGKRMMIWSDMFEFYTTVISRIPQSIIVVDWQYQQDVRFYMGHLFEMEVENRIALNHRLKLSTVMACAECGLNNAVSTIKYADATDCWGFLYTSWEKGTSFFYRSYPIIFFTGQLLAGKAADEAWKNTMNYIFGSSDPLLSNAVHLAISDDNYRHYNAASEGNLLTRPFEGLPGDRFAQSADILGMLKASESKITAELGKKVWKDLCNLFNRKCCSYELKTAFWDILDYGFMPEFYDRALRGAKKFEALIDSESSDWENFRAGIAGNKFAAGKKDILDSLQNNLDNLLLHSFVKVRFCMPDQYVVNNLTVELLVDGKWLTAAEKSAAKSDQLAYTVFERAYFLPQDVVPQAARLTVSGMGGRGICYLEVISGGKRFTPAGISEVSGTVEHPEYLLNNDVKFSWFNTQMTRYNYFNPESSRAKHSVTLTLAEKE